MRGGSTIDHAQSLGRREGGKDAGSGNIASGAGAKRASDGRVSGEEWNKQRRALREMG